VPPGYVILLSTQSISQKTGGVKEKNSSKPIRQAKRDCADETSFFALAFLRAILDRYAYVPVVSEETMRLLSAQHMSWKEH